jgi:hypothetical protein
VNVTRQRNPGSKPGRHSKLVNMLGSDYKYTDYFTTLFKRVCTLTELVIESFIELLVGHSPKLFVRRPHWLPA